MIFYTFSSNFDESKITEKQNTLYDDLDEEESQSLQRSKRDGKHFQNVSKLYKLFIFLFQIKNEK